MQNDNDAGIELTAQQVWRIKRLLERSTGILTRLIRITVRAKRWFQTSSVITVFAKKKWIVEYLQRTEEDITVATEDNAVLLGFLDPYPEV